MNKAVVSLNAGLEDAETVTVAFLSRSARPSRGARH
jgi:hypothetical protein